MSSAPVAVKKSRMRELLATLDSVTVSEQRLEAITEPTPEQNAAISVVAQAWNELSELNEPPDFDMAAEGIAETYEKNNFKVPPIVFVASPMSQGLARAACMWVLAHQTQHGKAVFAALSEILSKYGAKKKSSRSKKEGPTKVAVAYNPKAIEAADDKVMKAYDQMHDDARIVLERSLQTVARVYIDWMCDYLSEVVGLDTGVRAWGQRAAAQTLGIREDLYGSILGAETFRLDEYGIKPKKYDQSAFRPSVVDAMSFGSPAEFTELVQSIDFNKVVSDEELHAAIKAAMVAEYGEGKENSTDFLKNVDHYHSVVEQSVYDSVYGAQESGWLVFYDYCRRVCGFKSQTDSVAGLLKAAAAAGWWLPHKDVCWVCDRPAEVHCLPSQSVLNREDGAAVNFRLDNWSLYVLENYLVSRKVVMAPETQTVEEIQKESNAEVQRIRIDRYGREKYIIAAGAKLIDERMNEKNNQPEKLYVLKENGEDVKWIALIDPSTGRQYMQRVDKAINTCEEAQNWMSFGLELLSVHRS